MSPFLKTPETEWVAANNFAFAIRDHYPVSPGHTLVVSKRLVETWFDATKEEQQALLELVEIVTNTLDAEYSPTGYNIGFNAGADAGQTIPHLHVHVIPRYSGDMEDPRGGIRHVIPSRGNYLTGGRRALVTPQGGEMRRELMRCLEDHKFNRVDLLVAFMMRSGVDLLADHISGALERGASIRVLTTDYLMVTDVGALGFFLDRIGPQSSGGALEVRVFEATSRSFHPKAYLFMTSTGEQGTAFVGSSNLSRSALQTGIEWNLRTTDVDELGREFEKLWISPSSRTLTREWLDEYDRRKRELGANRVEHKGELVGDEQSEEVIRPWSVQQEALDALAATRLDGFSAGLVVMATGLGKTWLAAFDSSRPGIKRVLFIAHREEILTGARDVFRRVRPSGTFTMLVGGESDMSGDVVFASIQSLQNRLEDIPPSAFDYIVVDEFHHAAAPTYRRVLAHFEPRFLLGLTATPDRTDSADLLTLCDDNLVYDCGLLDGLKRGLLCPFRYRAIKDVADYENIPWRSGRFVVEQLTERLETGERAQQVFEEWSRLGGSQRKTIAFCCSITHADYMAEYFSRENVRAIAVHSGASSASRADSLAALDSGEIEIIFSVDLFNEGIDVPNIDLVLMLRPTESPIVFLQQLGRGLRIAEGKEFLDVLDMVGNHRSFLSKARFLAALFGRHHLTDREAVDQLHEAQGELPAGCSIIVETEAIDLLRELLGAPSGQDRLTDLVRSWAADHDGERPTALQMSLASGQTFGFGKKSGGWFGFLASIGLLSPEESEVLKLAQAFFVDIEHGAYTKSFKLITLQVMCSMGGLRKPTSINEIAMASRWRMLNDPRLLHDLRDASDVFRDPSSPDDAGWNRYWRRNPIAALTGEAGWFAIVEGQLSFELEIPDGIGPFFDRMAYEILDYRLHRYLIGKERLRSERKLKPLDESGMEVDATFQIVDVLGEPLTIIFESAGGGRASGGRNTEYATGVDLVLGRLGRVGAVLLDVIVDSEKVQSLPIEERRLLNHESQTPTDLSNVDVVQLRKSILRGMKYVGRKDASPGGNARKRVKFLVGGLAPIPTAGIESLLVTGALPTPTNSDNRDQGQLG